MTTNRSGHIHTHSMLLECYRTLCPAYSVTQHRTRKDGSGVLYCKHRKRGSTTAVSYFLPETVRTVEKRAALIMGTQDERDWTKPGTAQEA